MPPPEMSAITFLLRAAFPAGREGRSGWRDREVMTRLESALEHSAALFLLALFVKFRLNLRLSVEELAGQAIAHDLHEGVAPDRNPARVFSKSMTRRQLRIFWRNAATRVRKWVGWETLFKAEEKKAMWELTEGMPRRARTAFRRWWLNYYEKRNPEAQLLRKLHPLVDLAKGFGDVNLAHFGFRW